VTKRRGERRKQLLDTFRKKRILEIERGSNISPSLNNWLWKRLYTCRKTDCGLNDIKEHVVRYFIANKAPIKTSGACMRHCERIRSVLHVCFRICLLCFTTVYTGFNFDFYTSGIAT
jgi:hypothetical protein